MIDLALFDGETRVAVPTEQATACTLATGPRGLESITAEIPLSTIEAFDLYSRLGRLQARLTHAGQQIGRGRVEDPSLTDADASITALGPWRELADLPYTALWSASGVEGWFESSPVYNTTVLSSRAPELYEYEFSERIVISLIKGTSYPASGARVGGVAFRGPHLGVRDIVGLEFRVRVLIPTNWLFQVNRYDGDDFSTATNVLSVTSAGVLIDRAYHLLFTGSKAIEIFILNDTGATSTPAGETGSWYCWLSDLRVVTASTNRIAVQLTANRNAGASVTADVGSTAGMYVGQRLNIGNGATGSEWVTVESITNSTQFVATFATNHLSGDDVRAYKIRPDEIVATMPAYLTATNSGGVLSSSTALIQSCDRDVLSAVWEDTTPADIIGELAERGSATARFEAQVWANGLLVFRPAGSSDQTWYVDAADLRIDQTLDGLINSVYPRYEGPDGRTLRGANQADAVSTTLYGLTRRGAVDADTTNATIAGQLAAVARDQTSAPVPRVGLTVDRVYTSSGALAPLEQVRTGDTVVIRNLPPAAGQAIDRIRTFRLAETRLDLIASTLTLVPESPLPDIEHQQAAVFAAAEIAAASSGVPAALPTTILAPQQNRRRNPTP